MAKQDQHEHKDKDVVSGIRYGHAKIPKFLLASYLVVTLWGGYYAFTAEGIDDRSAMAATPTKENGQALVQARCAGCHSMGTDQVFGPGLQGVGSRMTPEEITKILAEGRGQMPAPSAMGLSETELESIQLFLESNK